MTRCAAWVRPGDVIDLAKRRDEQDDRGERDSDDGDDGAAGAPVGVRA